MSDPQNAINAIMFYLGHRSGKAVQMGITDLKGMTVPVVDIIQLIHDPDSVDDVIAAFDAGLIQIPPADQ